MGLLCSMTISLCSAHTYFLQQNEPRRQLNVVWCRVARRGYSFKQMLLRRNLTGIFTNEPTCTANTVLKIVTLELESTTKKLFNECLCRLYVKFIRTIKFSSCMETDTHTNGIF